MKIALVAPFEESVPPKKYGGTEIVVYNLLSELVARGHDVTLFATGDSEVSSKLVPVFPTGIRTTEPFASDAKTREMGKFMGITTIMSALQNDSFDIVHNHIGWRFLPFIQFFSSPVVTTLHGPPGAPYERMIHTQIPEAAFISISDNQRKSFPELRYEATVYNGIDLALYPFQEKASPEPYLFFLARFSPEKGPKEAIEIARNTGMKLKMAVKVDKVDQAFFDSCKPMLEEAHVEMIGEIGMKEKVELLQNATALVAPIQWEEPFGLFVVEAMACGTPVVGMKRGALPELITHGVDGFLGQTVEDLTGFVKEVSSIDRGTCRKKVEDHFSKEKMADGYIAAYEKILEEQNYTFVTTSS